ncbi:MAG: hypothetical protein COZ06_23865 [Armatimonadetes bacterium CG_4_10_14_3_um_filter_66_18]|nr:hypothetical protein [Armatimonadota bacterium]OIP11369.1 MAG: hypothetical protein AUJ96_02425 [Armatimonadetes bacterium CG2_30_66_41]PIU92520.1 MAG: hypothetical protein COS65_17525 [Armatimonadetes bacterium CG06_land_8_20_14_3_00_66_21]PIW16895.1 MAG: hypothetical protein COW34_05580 [Armatimonadetes bacterium CG17_big_fil_post_rev_8_21_14_2_50_66_6]PIX39493.1 MAG: hypothetical protein COZ57_28120 [Armatimonadetes bacterium CG_4_8_14_3_um_filter_66_20]PIY42974.1 MAG: hypothetical prote
MPALSRSVHPSSQLGSRVSFLHLSLFQRSPVLDDAHLAAQGLQTFAARPGRGGFFARSVRLGRAQNGPRVASGQRLRETYTAHGIPLLLPPLPEPWFVSGIENLKATALVESPTHFRKRRIFVLGNFLERA